MTTSLHRSKHITYHGDTAVLKQNRHRDTGRSNAVLSATQLTSLFQPLDQFRDAFECRGIDGVDRRTLDDNHFGDRPPISCRVAVGAAGNLPVL